MTQVLKYVGKGQWVSVDERDVEPGDKLIITENKAQKKSSSDKVDDFFSEIKNDVAKNGYKSIKVSTILKSFGIKKRNENNTEKIKSEFSKNGLYALPEYSKELKLTQTVRLYSYRVRQLGDLFETERDLENYVDENLLYKNLNIKEVIRQHSPKGTKDRLDFKGNSIDDEVVVLELKNAGGGKSAVEQVLRYAGLLKMEYPTQKIRQILVTGIQNYETALAINGMSDYQRDLFEWYLYKYHKDINQFEFVQVADEEINFSNS
ncbi:endonuclease NucS [Flavobacterium selenitireducens]|uniref:endonuclease NucS n=1 Tax=Flavobacterium selenitireducens TaxID=2722704 RepID=UPI00168B19D0|nr:endonuclease NucS [Flavobacterium selenitireducens]MBD3584055.1 DUF91 domain-containing protein [Flavobacterium selenitireducens]